MGGGTVGDALLESSRFITADGVPGPATWARFAATGLTGAGRAVAPLTAPSTAPWAGPGWDACGAGEPCEPSLPPPTWIVIRLGRPDWACGVCAEGALKMIFG